MGESEDWYEDFFDATYAFVLGSERHECRAGDEAKLVKRVLRLRKGQRVLDCPCGLGRLTLGLADAGLAVTGADLSALYVRRARKRAKDAGADVRFLRCDMRELPFDGEFDAVVNWFSSFGYFDDEGNIAAAAAAHRALKPGGKYLLELMNKSCLLSHFNPERREETINGVHIAHKPCWDAKRNRVRDAWTMTRGRSSVHRRLSMRVFNGAEIRSVLRAAGFGEVALLGHKPFGRFTRHSRRFFAIATKARA